ncbi:MAG: hypothetical protein IJ087_23090 [Eggerthellaceae bacterium]|nr:hypothetical protein [Eggerthellaceae bacterium]MBQ9004733.1 hypothetical protein [Eggerthellaceae bacterium]
MILSYEGTDITDEVTVSRCVYEACEIGRVPWLSVEFDDAAGLWDKWGPQPGERIAVVEEGIAATGAMYVDKVEPQSGGYAIHATAMPIADARAVREWRDTTLLTVAGQLSTVLGLGFESHGCDDMAIAYARQDDEGAAAVLSRLAVVSGCTLDVYDGRLHLCSRGWVESRTAVGTVALGEESDYAYSRKAPFASCTVSQPATADASGLMEECGEGEPRLAVVLDKSIALPGSAELRRACSGVLAHENARRSAGYVRGSSLSPYSPGSVCVVSCEKTPSISGRSVVTRVRNDFAEQSSKTWWRTL